jgi:hypothetical protein
MEGSVAEGVEMDDMQADVQLLTERLAEFLVAVALIATQVEVAMSSMDVVAE